MPKLNLVAAKQIKGQAGEILALKGPGFAWSKPSDYGKLSLITQPSVDNFTVSDQSHSTVTLKGPGGTRRSASWLVDIVPGTRLRMKVSGTGQIWVRFSPANDPTATTVTQAILNVSGLPVTVDVTSTVTAGRFAVLSAVNAAEAADFRITDFRID